MRLRLNIIGGLKDDFIHISSEHFGGIVSEMSIHSKSLEMTHKKFHVGDPPYFDLLEIETIDRKGTNDVVKIFLGAEDSERLSRAVQAFNEAWEKCEETP